MSLRPLSIVAPLTAIAIVFTVATAPTGSANAQPGLVYASVGFNSSHDAQLVVGTLGGTAPRVIFQGRYPASVTRPAVSPDGRRVAYIEDNGAGKRIAVINADGTGHVVLTGREAVRQGPVWSPDGTKLYFSVQTSCGGCGRTLVVPADGSHSPAPVAHGGNSDPQSLRRDGKSICFDYLPAGSKSERLGVMNLDGTGRHGVGPTNLFTAAWRPRSNVIAVSRFLKYVVSTGPVIIQIQLVNADTGRSHPLTATQDPSKSGAAYPLAWSPDGNYLYYEHFAVNRDQQVRPRIYRIRSDGTEKVDVTPTGFTGGAQGDFGLQGR